MIALVRNLYTYRELLESLVRREIAARYRQTLLGPAWAILQPLVLMVLFTMIQTFISIPSDGIPYPLFAYAALLPWTFFSNSIVFAAPSIIQNRGIVQKIYFPRELFPTAAVLVTLFDFAMAFVVLLGLMLFYGIVPKPTLVLLPILLLIQLLLSLGVGYMAAALGAFKRDVVFGMPFIMQFWMFLSPVVYSLSSVPEKYRALYLLNPMPLGYATFGAVLVLFLGYRVFRALEMRFADVV